MKVADLVIGSGDNEAHIPITYKGGKWALNGETLPLREITSIINGRLKERRIRRAQIRYSWTDTPQGDLLKQEIEIN